jgi:dTDP-4-dehydrorhamnose reductase
MQVRLEPAAPGEFAAKVARPKYSVLENAALKNKGFNLMRDWREGLENYLTKRPHPIHTGAV